MKKYYIVLILLISNVSFYSCDSLDDYTHFPIIVNNTFTIPQTTGMGIPLTIESISETNANAIFSDNNTHSDLIESAYLDYCTISITSPSTATLDALENIEIYLSADGLSTIRMAWSTGAMANSNHMDLITTTEDLSPYLTRDNYTLTIHSSLSHLILENYTLEISNSFDVNAQVLGL